MRELLNNALDFLEYILVKIHWMEQVIFRFFLSLGIHPESYEIAERFIKEVLNINEIENLIFEKTLFSSLSEEDLLHYAEKYECSTQLLKDLIQGMIMNEN